MKTNELIEGINSLHNLGTKLNVISDAISDMRSDIMKLLDIYEREFFNMVGKGEKNDRQRED